MIGWRGGGGEANMTPAPEWNGDGGGMAGFLCLLGPPYCNTE